MLPQVRVKPQKQDEGTRFGILAGLAGRSGGTVNSLHTTEVTASRTEYPSVQIVCRTYSGALEELEQAQLQEGEEGAAPGGGGGGGGGAGAGAGGGTRAASAVSGHGAAVCALGG